MNKSKIDWCDFSWNVVTGCLHGCSYCYAMRIAERFGSIRPEDINEYRTQKVHNVVNRKHCPYPFVFEPTFHEYRLDEPKRKVKSVKIFVSSMGDLFGEWVPEEWIQKILDIIEQCPQHTFMFLTKNPYRYRKPSILKRIQNIKNIWIGTTITSEKDAYRQIEVPQTSRTFLSIEPLLGPINTLNIKHYQWVIIGAQTGPGAVVPNSKWVKDIVKYAKDSGIPVFLKDNLYWPEKIQEYPDFQLNDKFV